MHTHTHRHELWWKCACTCLFFILLISILPPFFWPRKTKRTHSLRQTNVFKLHQRCACTHNFLSFFFSSLIPPRCMMHAKHIFYAMDTSNKHNNIHEKGTKHGTYHVIHVYTQAMNRKYSWMQTMIIIIVNFRSKSRLFFALFVIYCHICCC